MTPSRACHCSRGHSCSQLSACCTMVGCSDNGHLVKLGRIVLAMHSAPSMHRMARSLVHSCWRESDAPHLRKRLHRAEESNTTPCLIGCVVRRCTRAHFTQERIMGWVEVCGLIEGTNGGRDWQLWRKVAGLTVWLIQGSWQSLQQPHLILEEMRYY